MSKKNNRSLKLLKLIPGLEASENKILIRSRRKHTYYDNSDTKRELRSKHNLPLYTLSTSNSSTDDSFMITNDKENDRDETYVPATADIAANSSNQSNNLTISLEDISNCTEYLTLAGVYSDLNTNETHLIDQVASNITVGDTEHILVDNSDNSIIENSDPSNMLEVSKYQENMYIPPSESEESYLAQNYTVTSQSLSPSQTAVLSNMLNLSNHQDDIFIPPNESEASYITKNHTVTRQTFSPSQTTVSSNMSEQSPYHDNPYVPPLKSVEPYITKNHTVTSQSLSPIQTTVNSTQDPIPTTLSCTIADPNSHIDHSSTNSEFDDSDRDETYNPASTDSYSDSSNTKETADTIIYTKCETRHSYLDKSQDSNSHTEEINTKEPRKKYKRIRMKDYCFFCETDVLNFARHIIRHHSMECEVQKILSYPKKSCTRKNLLTNLRKKGNYIKNVVKCYKPMKKSSVYPNIDYLPCEKCLGFYSRKQLWKHKKKCQPLSETANSQVEAQNFMLRNLKVDKKLKEDVFPKMRPDRISLEAKKDSLICAFGAQYLQIHREKHFINVTSRKMRELSKLLIELKKLKPTIKNLMDSLRPQNYDLIVTATKKVSNYDDKTDRYGAPTYAMNISTSLKQCSNIAIMMILKSDSNVNTAIQEADLKTLIHLIETNWKFDVSSQANSDLNIKKWNKVTIVPLASDLKLLKNYLCDKAKIAASKLTESLNSDIEAYTSLVETIYCRVLLLNRRRPGELQRLLLSTYLESHNDKNVYEEFERAISSAEKLLIKSFKRIVIRGKRGRGVPVLLTDEVQSDIDLLISVRRKYISDKNPFLFSKPGSENTLCGYKVLEKYANRSGAKNPKAITTTKLRKHLATLTQMFSLKEVEIEQLANFMGHTQAVHRQNYRLSDDVYQTAKLSKLLLLMESGDADCHKGKSLDDIDLNLEQDLLQDVREDNDDIMEYEAIMPTEEPNEQNITEKVHVDTPNITQLSDITNAPDTITKKKRKLTPWTPQQKNIVTKFFSKHIKNKQPPKRHECDELRNLHPEILHNKDWLKIKVFIQNTYTKGIK